MALLEFEQSIIHSTMGHLCWIHWATMWKWLVEHSSLVDLVISMRLLILSGESRRYLQEE
jgi:hypothetical protein